MCTAPISRGLVLDVRGEHGEGKQMAGLTALGYASRQLRGQESPVLVVWHLDSFLLWTGFVHKQLETINHLHSRDEELTHK